jgi:hypothetical protein
MPGVRLAAGCKSAPCRSRNLETAFHSLATTLSPPLRGRSSRPAPSIPHKRPARIRSIPAPSLRFGFEADSGRYHRQKPVSRATFPRSCSRPRSPLPFGSLETPRIKAFNRLRRKKLTSPDDCCFFRFGYRSVNPGTESMMAYRQDLSQTKKGGFFTLSSTYCRIAFQRVSAHQR